MKKWKVMMSCTLAAVMLTAFTACGQKQQEAEERTEESAQEAEAPVQTEPEEEEVQAAEPEEEAQEPEASGEAGKTLVVYYSATGHTQDVSEYIAAATGGDTFELVPQEPYSSEDLDWTADDSRVVYEHDNPDARAVELVEVSVSDWEAYDTVFIGYPIWWGIAAWPVDSFVKANDFTGKTVIPFCTSSSSGLGESGELLAEMAGTGDWQEGVRFGSGVSEDEVKAWVENLGL